VSRRAILSEEGTHDFYLGYANGAALPPARRQPGFFVRRSIASVLLLQLAPADNAVMENRQATVDPPKRKRRLVSVQFAEANVNAARKPVTALKGGPIPCRDICLG
jgi:hypothetical protein